MRFALHCLDKPGSLKVREANREAHLSYIRDSGVVEMAGPLLDENGDMAGSLLILDVADAVAARAWANKDPYAGAGLFQSVSVMAWNKVLG